MCLCQCCCGAGTPEEEMIYTRCNRLTLAFLILFAFCLLCVGGVCGYLGGHKTYDGGVDLMSQAVTAIERMELLNTDVVDPAFKGLSGIFSATGGAVTYDSSDVTKAIKDVKDIINDFKKSMVDIKDIFNYALPGFYGFCAVISLLGCLSWWCGNGQCSMTMGMMSSVMLFLTWLLFIIFWITGSFLDDTCVALSEHYNLDCMKEPGKTCSRAKLTDFFQCPKVTTVSGHYDNAWKLLDSASGNGASTSNTYGTADSSLNKMYGQAALGKGNRFVLAPAAIASGSAQCGTGGCGQATLGMEPYTTCKSGYSFNSADSQLNTYVTTPLNGNRATLCETAGTTNTDQSAPQNTAKSITINSVSRTTKGLVAKSGSTNPPWAASTTPTFAASTYSIGTCERACLNASASSGGILDSLTNFGGNAMYRKFVYESFTSVYTGAENSNEQGYATCGSDASSKIAWVDNTYISNYATYQNFSDWMITYSGMSYSDPCIPQNTGSASTGCVYTDQTTYWQIPYTGNHAAAGNDQAACIQAAVMSVSDIMFALSYIASCSYIKAFAKLTAVESTGACFDLGDGLVFLIMAQGLVGIAFFITTVVGVMGYRRFNSDHDAANKKEKHADEEDVYTASGFKETDEANDDEHLSGPGIETALTTPGVEPNQQAGAQSTTHDAWV
jgi:hypothetical protein